MTPRKPFAASPLVVTAVALALATGAGAHQGPPVHDDGRPHHDGGPRCDAEVIASFSAVDDAMRHLEQEIANTRGKKSQRAHLKHDLGALMARVQEARVAACRASRPEVVVVTPPAPRVPLLDRDDEARLVSAMRRAAFEDERLAVLSLGVRDACVTADQARELVRELSFSRGRVDAVRVLAPRIVDGGRAFLVLDAMAFEADRREARDLLSATPQDPRCRVPARA